MDLTFQVPMQYCSLQHQTLLPSPVTYTTGCCFHLGSIFSFFLELLLHASPVAYWASTDLGSSSLSVISFCLFVLFKIDLKVDRVPEELWREVHDIVREAVIKTIPKKKKCKKAKWLYEEALQITEKKTRS